jgi:hypothetical protein
MSKLQVEQTSDNTFRVTFIDGAGEGPTYLVTDHGELDGVETRKEGLYEASFYESVKQFLDEKAELFEAKVEWL